MRTYVIYYYAERNDTCVDCEKTVESDSVLNALHRFNEIMIGISYKRVTGIIEISSNKVNKKI